MSNLQLAFPTIPLASMVITVTGTGVSLDSNYNEYDYFYGARDIKPRLASSVTAQAITCDLGVGASKTANHLIIARADLLKSNGVTTITLDRSTDGVSWTTEHTVSSFSSYALKGYNSNDLFDTFTESSAYRYWRVSMSGSSNKFICSKISFGKILDLETDPFDVKIDIIHKIGEIQSMLGNTDRLRLDEPKRKIELKYTGVSDAKIQELHELFYAGIVFYYPCFLVTTESHSILENNYLVHCWITDLKTRKVHTDYNELSIELLEQVG